MTEEAKKESVSAEAAVAEAKADDANEEVVVPEKFAKLVEEIAKMSVLDLSELVKILEKKFGVSAAAPMMMAGVAGAAAGEDGAAEEKSAFDVELAESGSSKIAVIKVVREVSGKGLKEAKDMVDGAPTVIAAGLKKEEAEELKKKLEEAGATVNLK